MLSNLEPTQPPAAKADNIVTVFMTPINSWGEGLKIALWLIPQSQHLFKLISEHQQTITLGTMDIGLSRI